MQNSLLAGVVDVIFVDTVYPSESIPCRPAFGTKTVEVLKHEFCCLIRILRVNQNGRKLVADIFLGQCRWRRSLRWDGAFIL